VSQPVIVTPVVTESPYVQLDLEDAIKEAESEIVEMLTEEEEIAEQLYGVNNNPEVTLSIDSEEKEEVEVMEEELEAIDFHNTVTEEVEEIEEEELLIAEDAEDEDEDDHSYFL
jgi:methionyl-tRNA formyltransferase